MSWIRLRKSIQTVAEVVEMRELLGTDFPNMHIAEVVGHLANFWDLADTNSRDGHMAFTAKWIDAQTVVGFTAALMIVGWLEGEDMNYVIPSFERFNPQTDKERVSGKKTPKTKPTSQSKRTTHDPVTGKFIRKPGQTILGAANGANGDRDGEFPGPVTVLRDGHRDGHRDGDSTVDFTDRKTTVLATVEPALPLGFHRGTVPRGEEKRVEKKRIDKNKKGETSQRSGPPSLDLALDFARENQINEGYVRMWFAAMEVTGFRDKSGAALEDWRAYLFGAAKIWQTRPPYEAEEPTSTAAPVAEGKITPFKRNPPAAWQIQKDLKEVEARLKQMEGGWRPNPDDLKILRAEKKRLMAQLIARIKEEQEAETA